MSKRSQVIVAGGGPVGVGFAIDLAQRGIACTLIERRIGMHNIPKGQKLTQRTLEHFYYWGCVDEVRAARLLPPEVPTAGIVAYRDLTSEYWHNFQGREIVGNYYFQTNDRMPQYLFEAVLRRRMARLPLVDARFGWAVKSVAQNGSGVGVGIVHEAGGGAEEMLEADYVVGCPVDICGTDL